MNVTDWLVLLYFVALVAGVVTLASRTSMWWKPLLIVLVLSLAGMFLYLPGHYTPRDQLRPGIDLAGGTKLIYDVAVPEGKDPDQVIQETINILKQRVDPSGTKNLLWRQIAGNRMEIQMPLATASTLDKRQAFREARDALLEGNIAKSEVTAALRREGEQRAQQLRELAGEDQKLLNQLQTLATHYDELQRVTEPYQEAESLYREAQKKLDDPDATLSLPAGMTQLKQTLSEYRQAQQQLMELKEQAATQSSNSDGAGESDQSANGAATQPRDDRQVDPSQIEAARKHANRFKQEILDALNRRRLEASQAYREVQNAYQQALDQVLGRNIPPSELERILNLPAQAQGDAKQSPRAQAIEQLVKQHPERAEQIRTVVEKFRAYDQVSGRFDDPEDLVALLEGAGVVEFRIGAATEPIAQQRSQRSQHSPEANITQSQVEDYRRQLQQEGPRAGQDDPWRWYPVDELENFLGGGEDAVERLQQQIDAAEAAEAKREVAAQFFQQRGYVGALYGGQYYLLLGNTEQTAIRKQEDSEWEISSASMTRTRNRARAIAFTLNVEGGQLMGQLTGPNLGKAMAITLDDQVISAPTLQAEINERGQITGQFTEKEQAYLLRTLKAGSLEGELKGPVSIQTTGPSLGQDNLNAGLKASIGALIIVALLAAGYYFFAGLVADFALAANMVLILGIMAMISATFTLPGIAGLVLTIGMAIDANVLVFERIREELERDMPVSQAIRTGYQKALSTVLDANITTLITCLVLYYVATAEVRGFALVLGIGIVATLFTALFCTRVLLDLWVTYGRSHRLSMLPTTVPAVRKALSPAVDWIGKRHGFFALSAVLLLGGLALVGMRGQNMLDIEFRAGTQVTFDLKEKQRLSIGEVRQRLDRYGQVAQRIQEGASASAFEEDANRRVYQKLKPIIERINQTPADDEATGTAQPAAMGGGTDGAAQQASSGPVDFSLFSEASVVTLGRTENGTAGSFQISTLITNNEAVSSVIKAAFEEYLDASKSRPIAFEGDDVQGIAQAAEQNIVFPINTTNDQNRAKLGTNIGEPGVYPRDITDKLGGAAFVLRDLQPAVTVKDAQQRIERMQMRPQYSGLDYREFEVIGLDPAEESETQSEQADGGQRYRSVVVIVSNETTNYDQNPEALTKENGLAATSWPWIKDAMKRDTALGSVSNFSGQISATMQQQAIVAMALALLAVVAYIWFRFGSLRYGLAAIVALVHDVTITLGLVALAGWVYDTWIGSLLLLDPFKIDLAMVAALLTIIGYSLNDTIVVFDRIRENRGRLAHATPAIINDSINQTISRTALTSGTTLAAVLVLYIFGGSGVHGFAFSMIVGVISGTYSSIAIAAPTLLVGTGGKGAPASAKRVEPQQDTTQPQTAAAASKV